MERARPLLQQDLGETIRRPLSPPFSRRGALHGIAVAVTLLGFWIPCPPARTAQLSSNNPSQSFAVALPEMEGPVTMGIFSTDGHLVRLLYWNAPIESIPAGLNGLIMTWDGKDDQGGDVPAGTYMARGLVHGPILISSLPASDDAWRPTRLIQTEEPRDTRFPRPAFLNRLDPFPKNRIQILAAKDELQETRPLLAISAERDGAACLLNAEGLPLIRFPMENPLPVTSIFLSNGSADGSAELMIERGGGVEKYSLSGLHRLVPLNAGALEISPDAFHLMPGAGESAP